MLTLSTERLDLRPIVLGDAPALYALNSDPEVYRYTGEPPPSSLSEVEQRIAAYPDYRDYGFGRLACVPRRTSEMIGFCGLKKLPELSGEVDIGFRLARSHWGQGLATEAATEVLRFGFETLELPRIIALVDADNTRSIRVLEKLGLSYERKVTYFDDVACLYARHRTAP